MRGSFLSALVILNGLALFAQLPEPVPAPADVILSFTTDGDIHQFHLGELIPVRYSYRSAAAVGKYLLVSPSSRLFAGRGFGVECSPSGDKLEDSPVTSTSTEVRFEALLSAPCGGVGRGSYAACGDCDGDIPIQEAAISFGPVPLNQYLRLHRPGKYTCAAASAEITSAPATEKIRPALLVKSNDLDLTIIDDPEWSHSAVVTYTDAFDRLCRGAVIQEGRFAQCSDLAKRITYLDTAESLSSEVKFFDGRHHGWEDGFWDAIRRTSYPHDAVRLMTDRFQSPEFEVSEVTLEWLAAEELRSETPDAFGAADSAAYHALAVDKLRKFVRLLGDSLPGKKTDVLKESAGTYRRFAGNEYCEAKPLIPKNEQVQVLAAAGISP